MTFSDFFSSLGDLDWLAVIVGTIAMFVFGAIWYGPLFGKAWGKGHGVAAAGGKMPPVNVMVMGLIATFVLNVGIAYFIPSLHVLGGNFDATFETLFVSALMLGVLVIGAAIAGGQVYLKTPWSVWFIDVGYYVIGIAIAAYVQDLMR